MALPALSVDSVSVVMRGSFNPAIFSPAWLLSQKLIGASEYDAAEVEYIRREAASFRTGWLQVLVTLEAFQVLTDSPDEFERCRDVAVGILEALQHTPLAFLGINRQVHFPLKTFEEWHAIGDSLAPKEIWEGVVTLPGLRALNIQGVRPDNYGGRVHVLVEPSQVIPQSIFVAHNDHFALKIVDAQPTSRAEFPLTAEQEKVEPSPDRIPIAIGILSNEWSSCMRRAEAAIERVAESGRRKS